jgi:hypothetical protein
VADERDPGHAERVGESQDVVAHQLERVRPRPVAAPVSAKIECIYAVVSGECPGDTAHALAS